MEFKVGNIVELHQLHFKIVERRIVVFCGLHISVFLCQVLRYTSSTFGAWMLSSLYFKLINQRKYQTIVFTFRVS